MGKKLFFTKHAKSSAALISLGIHVILIIVAISFVAVTVITKEDTQFEAKPVSRPKMQLKKLQVPVNVKKKAPKPRLRKRIVVQPKMNQNMPDIKLPEITGVKGGIGNADGGGMGAGGIGFSMPQIELFGIKSKGEKIFLLLDTTNSMLVDEMGGIPAYTIIKAELIRIIEELPSTALFNVCIFGGGQQTLFSKMVPATSANAEKAKKWLEPLNSSENAVKTGRYGIRTLGPGGKEQRGDYVIGSFATKPAKDDAGEYRPDSWYSASMISMMQQADTIFILTDTWGRQKYAVSSSKSTDEWIATTTDGKKWAQRVEEAKKLLKKENEQRRARGEPPRVISGGRNPLVQAYFPGTPSPPRPQYYNFTPKEFAEAFVLMREKHRPAEIQARSGLSRNKSKRMNFSLNVVHFIEKGSAPHRGTVINFKELVNLCKGDYQTIAGLDEIRSYVSSDSP